MCTGVRLIAHNGGVACGRTMEFGQKTESEIIMIPRGYTCVGTAPDQTAGLQWKTTYAAVGANMWRIPHIVDGINEKGLAGGIFYFPGYAQYQNVTKEQYAHTVAPWELLTYLLTTCATLQEVYAAVQKIFVGGVEYTPLGQVPPVHWVMYDASGKSCVIEYVDGVAKIHDNPLGVCTNAPTFDWHMTNLGNYVKMSAANAQPREFAGFTSQPFGQGSGMLGLPGDFTPPSRFVRAVMYSHTADAGATVDQACAAVFHVLSLFNIPVGVITESENASEEHDDYTQWTVVRDLVNKRYYWNTYNNPHIYSVDLMALELDAAQVQVCAMEYPVSVADKSGEFKKVGV